MNSSDSEIISQENQVRGLDSSLDPTQVDLKESKDELNTILKDLDEIKISQHLDALEVAQCYTRQCYGSLREFSLVVTDNDDNRLLRLHRPLRCSSRCFYACCHLQEMSINLPSKEKFAKVFEKWSCCLPQYEVEDEHGSLQFEIEGTFCHCRCCCNISFKINNAGGEQCALIKKDWSGCKELIGACNNYTVYYSNGLSSSDKSAILAAAFLLDFNYFQRHGKCF